MIFLITTSILTFYSIEHLRNPISIITELLFHVYKKLFTVNSSYGVAKFIYTLNSVNPVSCGSNYNVKIYRLTDSTDLYGGVLINTISGQPNGFSILQNGYYRVDVNLTTISSCTIGSITGNWAEGITDNSTIVTPYGTWKRRQYNAGGVRVKSLNDYDPVTGKTNTTSYYYKMYSTDSTMGSGLLASIVNMTSIENNFYTGCQYMKISPGSSYPLATEGGSYVVYPEVRTVENGNGWTDRI